MGRIAGVTAADTRDRLLRAAAESFESDGYDRARVADIARTAGLSNGALYSHFDSKADLLAEALRCAGSDSLAELFMADPEHTVVDLLVEMGRGLNRVERSRGALVVEALVAARHDPDVAAAISEHVRERDDWMVGVAEDATAAGALDPSVSPQALSRFCLMVVLGSHLLEGTDLPPLDDLEWSTLITRLASALVPDPQEKP